MNKLYVSLNTFIKYDDKHLILGNFFRKVILEAGNFSFRNILEDIIKQDHKYLNIDDKLKNDTLKYVGLILNLSKKSDNTYFFWANDHYHIKIDDRYDKVKHLVYNFNLTKSISFERLDLSILLNDSLVLDHHS